jgi:hypothetical protein
LRFSAVSRVGGLKSLQLFTLETGGGHARKIAVSNGYENFSPPKNSLFGNAYSFFFSGTCSGKAVNERTAMQTTMVKPK